MCLLIHIEFVTAISAHAVSVFQCFQRIFGRHGCTDSEPSLGAVVRGSGFAFLGLFVFVSPFDRPPLHHPASLVLSAFCAYVLCLLCCTLSSLSIRSGTSPESMGWHQTAGPRIIPHHNWQESQYSCQLEA